ncbi:unnamed protein product [Porites lobata]|uniref:Metalloendopeptidase n=1 Tax=Porites lobata TaxID=104759 RepID=A0ABN8RBD9_9CNID|nr:unnamed protein product [Porites lobata]
MKFSFIFTALLIVLADAENAEENKDLMDADLFEGDIVLEPVQRLAVDLGIEIRGSMGNRLWPNAIVPYTIAPSLSSQPKAMQAIENAMNEWSSVSCIRFIRRTTEQSYIEFFKGKGCYSSLGRTGKKQQLSLAAGCWGKITVAHEIAHALGFAHEQSRPDRDEYVTINFENIQAGKQHNFKKYSSSQINSLDTPYDYESVMHYGAKYFSKNNLPTIVPKQTGVKIGQRKYLSGMDILQMNLLYKCR